MDFPGDAQPIARQVRRQCGIDVLDQRADQTLPADGTVLRGTPATLAGQLGISPGDLLAAIEELTTVGWVMLEVGSQGELTARWVDDRPTNGSG